MGHHLFGLPIPAGALGQAGHPTYPVAGALLQPPSVHRHLRPEALLHRVFRLHRVLLRRGQLPPGLAVFLQPPLFRKAFQRLQWYLFQQIQHHPLAAAVHGRYQPFLFAPGKCLLQRDFSAGAVPWLLSAKPILKINRPFLRFAFHRMQQFFIFLLKPQFGAVCFRPHFLEISPRFLHRGQAALLFNLPHHRPLVLGRRIFPQVLLKLRFSPHPRLLQRGGIPAGQQQPQEVPHIPRQRLHAVLTRVHGTYRKDGLPIALYGAEMDAIHPGPAEDLSPLRRAGVAHRIAAALRAQRPQVNMHSLKFRIGHGSPPFCVPLMLCTIPWFCPCFFIR